MLSQGKRYKFFHRRWGDSSKSSLAKRQNCICPEHFTPTVLEQYCAMSLVHLKVDHSAVHLSFLHWYATRATQKGVGLKDGTCLFCPENEWLRATIMLVTFRVEFSSMSESTQTLQADLCYMWKDVPVLFFPPHKQEEKTWHTGLK